MKLLLLTLLALPMAAQFAETLEVRVLEIEATVVDRNQHAIEGLTREDFVVTIDGQPVEITNFSAVSRGVVRESVAATEHDAAVAIPVPTRLIIVIDDLSLHPEPKQRALRALRKYVDETMDASTTATVITWNGALTTRTTPTTRREILRSALAASAGEIPRGMAIDTERAERGEPARRAPLRRCRAARPGMHRLAAVPRARGGPHAARAAVTDPRPARLLVRGGRSERHRVAREDAERRRHVAAWRDGRSRHAACVVIGGVCGVDSGGGSAQRRDEFPAAGGGLRSVGDGTYGTYGTYG